MRVLILFLLTLLVWVAIPLDKAEAACRPITISDLPPLPSDDPPAPEPTGEDTGESGEEPPPIVEPPPPPPAPRSCFVYRMQWPVIGGETGSSFGSPRDGGARRHLGVDIFAPKLTPVVAVADGMVTEVHGPGGECCWVKIRHNDGWGSIYVHLNNDTVGTDDGRGYGIRPGLEVGSTVRAGEVIGWLGDSGNAETASPHVHFELRMRNGTSIDPLPSLRWAQGHAPVPSLEGTSGQFSIAYQDDDGTPIEGIFNLLTSLGAFTPCDEWGVRACPANPASLTEAGEWLTALSGVDVSVRLPPIDMSLTGDNELVASTLACRDHECTPPVISVGEAAKMIEWVLAWSAYESASELPAPPSYYWDADPATAWQDLVEARLATDCPVVPVSLDTMLTRAALADLLGQAFGHLPAIACDAVS